jgi:hypothetical protein
MYGDPDAPSPTSIVTPRSGSHNHSENYSAVFFENDLEKISETV